MRTILITGGAGFIGSSIALSLARSLSGVRIYALDNLKRRGSELNLPRLREAGVEFLHGDIRRLEDLMAVPELDLLLECSAEPAVMAGYGESPEYVIHTNLTGTVNCLELARRREAAMLFLSTSRIYPMDVLNRLAYREVETRFELEPQQPVVGVSAAGISEAFPIEGVRSFYGATKLSSEFLVQEYRAAYGMPAIINRMSVIGGPWQMGKSDQGLAALWAARHVFQRPLKYIGYGGAGKQVRDILHIDDLLDLIHYELAHFDELDGALMNCGGGIENSVSLLELTKICEAASGNALSIGSEPETRPADVPIFVTDNARVTERTGWTPKRSVADTIEDTVRWIREHQDALAKILD